MMRTSQQTELFNRVVEELSELDHLHDGTLHPGHRFPLPSTHDINLLMELIKEVLFPGYFGNSDVNSASLKYLAGGNLHKIVKLLNEQVFRAHRFNIVEEQGTEGGIPHAISERFAHDTINAFLGRLKSIRASLICDVRSAYLGDPAATNSGECIFCYPGIQAVLHYRVAHELFALGVPLLPRMISEIAHRNTGIDIHPGAQIADSFFIDHGTGTVIGATCIIGRNVRIYHGVTLGSRSFPLDDGGQIIKGLPRHPILEDNVTVYAGATILGRITIGEGSEVGGNVCLTEDVPSMTVVTLRGTKEKRKHHYQKV